MKKVQFMTMTALLTAIAILIPIAMPLKVIIPPASYTLGSHVAIFIAMFINPWMAIFVVLGSTFGFFISGAYPIIIVLRALSHISFAPIGAFYLQKHPHTIENAKSSWAFNIVMALIHAVGEVLVCLLFYTVSGNDIQSMFYVLFVLVGVGTIIHSMVDYTLAVSIYRVLKKRR